MRKTSGTSIEIYERYADQYDAGRFECVCGKLQNETEIRIVTRLIHQRGRILDAGAGTGRMATAMVGVAINVVGVDTSQRMLTLAKERADRMGLICIWNVYVKERDLHELIYFHSFLLFSLASLPCH